VNLPRYPKFGIADFERKEAYGDISAAISRWKWLPGPHQAYAFGLASLASLPNVASDQPSMSTYISEGIHFRGGSRECYTTLWHLDMTYQTQKDFLFGVWSGSYPSGK
jgi:hypothetical protein